ncbi:MAG: hypothetical protein K2Q25_07690 [Mycobacteriaceae bacterium]|nr:hypothetical protein [Mycobacteriaceae bacterium]
MSMAYLQRMSHWDNRGEFWAFVLEMLTELSEIIRGAVNVDSANEPPEDGWLDITHAILEITAIVLCFEAEHALEDLAPVNPTEAWVLSKVWIQRCFGITYWLLILFTALEYMSGFGAPDEGSDFDQGQKKFGDVYETLFDAKATHWTGTGAEAYNAKNETLFGLAKSMQDADRKITEIVAHQARRVQELRNEIAGLLAGVVGFMLAISFYMWRCGLLTFGAGHQCGNSEEEKAIQAGREKAAAKKAEQERQAFFNSRLGNGYCGGCITEVDNAITVSDSAATEVEKAPLPSPLAPVNWLPPLVAVVTIMSTAAAIVCILLMINEGKSTVDEIKKQREIYQQAASDAADISNGLGVSAPATGRTAVPEISRHIIPGFAAHSMRADAGEISPAAFKATVATRDGVDRRDPLWAPAGIRQTAVPIRPVGCTTSGPVRANRKPGAEENVFTQDTAVSAESEPNSFLRDDSQTSVAAKAVCALGVPTETVHKVSTG